MYSAVVVQEVLQRRQESWRWGAWWLALRRWQHSLVVQHLKQIQFSSVAQSCLTLCDPMDYSTPRPPCPDQKGEKASWVVASWGTTNQKKNHHFEVSSSLIPHNNNKPFLDGLWCEAKRGFYMTTGNDQLSSWTKKKLQSTFQSQTCTEKRWCSLYGGLLPVWSTTAFWIPVKPLLLRRELSKLTRCTKNCNACTWH